MELAKKRELLKFFKGVILCIIGSLVLAVGCGVFLNPLNIVGGGVSGIALIINHYLEPATNFYWVDIFVWIINASCLILSFIFLGYKFSIKSIVSTLAMPLFLTIIARTPMFDFIIKPLVENISDNSTILLGGFFGGSLVGLGCAITFIGGGSTGGLDVFTFMLSKYAGVKESISSFVLDSSVIIAGVFTLGDINSRIIPSLIGILSAFMCAFVIYFVYNRTNVSYIFEVITEKYKEVVDFSIRELDRGATIIDAVGGYTGETKKLVRLVLEKDEMYHLKEYISTLDPRAFITVTQTHKVIGEGFSALKPSYGLIKRKKKKNKDE